ncbi:YlzJ-like family protein [Bacillus sp. T33-2]|uniref:YlzJ-like family protein n=1 Tax=Bacillus sp. T33-2 TaxID=2054168 RepID=UPI000C75C230|nr:YlzJ-like family protein [Bacillus sp. T33-2]PLR94778.1 ribonuclease [Bacillus sp. T33-2]
MILYTMMPQELVYPGDGEATSQTMISYNGIPLLAELTDEHEYRVVRVLSTDPAHYLQPYCTPGSKISAF